MNSATENMNRQLQRNNGSQIKAKIKQLVSASEKQYNDAQDVIVALQNIFPYKRMLISYDGYLIPLDDKYFRIDPVNLGFKYGGDITCVGLITISMEKIPILTMRRTYLQHYNSRSMRHLELYFPQKRIILL